MTVTKPVKILLIEDNEGDIYLTQEAFKEGKLNNELSIARDGEEAIRYLMKEGPFFNAPTPDMILLDINLPKINGKEVLGMIKNHPLLKTIPVVILTTSSAEKDVFDSYSGYANCYIVKPVKLESFISVVKSIENFWMSIVTLP